MTPAARLRQAAQLARETAEAATPGPWEHDGDGEVGLPPPDARLISHPLKVADAAHIAIWSPEVAPPVAAWLERTAERMDAWATKFSGALWRHDGRLMPSTYAGFFEAEDWQLALEAADALLSTTGERIET